MSTLKCGCVYADSRNTPAVREGYELGGYLKEACDKHSKHGITEKEMSNHNDGGPAFPVDARYPGCTNKTETGMTLRDYFAAKAMQSLVGHLSEGIRPQDLVVMSEDAYMLADAMLAAREGKV